MKFSITNILLLVTVAALAITLAIALLATDPIVTVNCQDNSYSFEFRQELLKESLRWSESEMNPPLSVREAMEIADQICLNLNSASETFGTGKWTFGALCLTHLNIGYRDMRKRNSSAKWCYLVHFRPYKSMKDGIATFMILMNGTIYVGNHPLAK